MAGMYRPGPCTNSQVLTSGTDDERAMDLSLHWDLVTRALPALSLVRRRRCCGRRHPVPSSQSKRLSRSPATASTIAHPSAA